ncbi:unnamed protein product [Zymoseptoria tritici ST99CH_3D7]|uniref:Uncharacterized protein n=1 Tax=Zymoseptoria tritici (strain ST99CH_3D7) TaxID=1276538 RepID=A0A1X7RW96_ZYMT9|nr:unnamed protein product [Zymoseptoria tritici ST99CH_3D7]
MKVSQLGPTPPQPPLICFTAPQAKNHATPHAFATLLGFQLMHTTVLAGGRYHDHCYCRISNTAVGKEPDKINLEATKSACDDSNHSDFNPWPGYLACQATEQNGITGSRWDCLCKRIQGMCGDCGGDPGGWGIIQCGGGC